MRPTIRFIALAAALLLVALAVGVPALAGDPEGRPAAAKSLDPDRLSATPHSAGSHSPETVAPGSVTAPSHSPDSLVAHSRSPGSDDDGAAGNAAGPGPATAGSPDVARLPADAGGEDLPRQATPLVPEPPAPRPDAAPAVRQAWQAVQDAEHRLEVAQAAYTRMRVRNYPRGAARQRIEDARSEAIAAVNRARRRYARLATPPE